MRTRKNTRPTRNNDNLFGDYLYMLVNKHIRKMAGKFYTVIDQDQINDIVQDAYIRVVDKKHQFREDGNFEGWVFRICQNYVREIAPKQSKKLVEIIRYNVDGSDDSIGNDCDYLSYMADCTYTPDRDICEREGEEKIMKAIACLKGDNAELAKMMLEGYPVEYMEERFNCTNGTLRAKMCRLRKMLKSYGVYGMCA